MLKRTTPQEKYTIGVAALTEEISRHDKLRQEKDIIYNLLTGDEAILDSYVNPLVEQVVATRKEHMASDAQFGLSLVKVYKDRTAKHLIIFAALYMHPRFMDFLMNGNPETGLPPPPVLNRDRLVYFARTEVGPLYESFLNGVISLDQTVSQLRWRYIQTMGVFRSEDPMKEVAVQSMKTSEAKANEVKKHDGAKVDRAKNGFNLLTEK